MKGFQSLPVGFRQRPNLAGVQKYCKNAAGVHRVLQKTENTQHSVYSSHMLLNIVVELLEKLCSSVSTMSCKHKFHDAFMTMQHVLSSTLHILYSTCSVLADVHAYLIYTSAIIFPVIGFVMINALTESGDTTLMQLFICKPFHPSTPFLPHCIVCSAVLPIAQVSVCSSVRPSQREL